MAIYSFVCNFHDFKYSIIYAVSLGGDADTIGAMKGAIS
jgi:ADP-ribosylglycohydrolase